MDLKRGFKFRVCDLNSKTLDFGFCLRYINVVVPLKKES